MTDAATAGTSARVAPGRVGGGREGKEGMERGKEGEGWQEKARERSLGGSEQAYDGVVPCQVLNFKKTIVENVSPSHLSLQTNSRLSKSYLKN